MTGPTLSRWWWFVGLASGCAASPATMPDGSPLQRFMLHGPGYAQEMTFDGTTLANPMTNVKRFSDGLRGRLGSVSLFVTTKPGEVNGVLGGGAPIGLKVETPEPGGLKAIGLWGGRPCRLDMSDTKLTLTFSQCGYDLEAVGPATYRGRTACFGGLADRIQLDVPPAILAAPPEERAVWLVAFMAR